MQLSPTKIETADLFPFEFLQFGFEIANLIPSWSARQRICPIPVSTSETWLRKINLPLSEVVPSVAAAASVRVLYSLELGVLKC